LREQIQKWSWQEGFVDRGGAHLALSHDDYENRVVALVGPPREGVLPVEFLAAGGEASLEKVIADVRRKLNMYLLEAGGDNPWAYAIYHCRTSANVYSNVHWSHVGPEPS
jgi:hypothetical protein